MSPIKIAIQKSGRLNEKSVALLKNCGISFETTGRSLIAPCSNFPMEVLFLRDDDIPEYVRDHTADLGICGENVIAEKRVKVECLQKLGFGKCSLSIAVPKNTAFGGVAELNGKSVATTYPVILGDYLKRNGIDANIIEVSGSVEISPALGLSDAICDLVSTGGTLRSNGLKPVTEIMKSEAVLIGANGAASNPDVQELLLRIRSVLRAEGTKYVVLNVEEKKLGEIVALLPGVKSPTVVPLAEKGWVAVHSVVSEADFWEKMGQIKAAGAQGIVVMSMEKIIV